MNVLVIGQKVGYLPNIENGKYHDKDVGTVIEMKGLDLYKVEFPDWWQSGWYSREKLDEL